MQKLDVTHNALYPLDAIFLDNKNILYRRKDNVLPVMGIQVNPTRSILAPVKKKKESLERNGKWPGQHTTIALSVFYLEKKDIILASVSRRCM